MRAPPLDEDEEHIVYNWVDEQELSRPKKNIARDFSDGVLMAEIVHHYFPKYVELHNYSAMHSRNDKYSNWVMLNKKVLKKLHYQVHLDDIQDIIDNKHGVIEAVLRQLQKVIYKIKLKNEESKQMQDNGMSETSSVKSKISSISHSTKKSKISNLYKKNKRVSNTSSKSTKAKEINKNSTAWEDHLHIIEEMKETIMFMETKIKKYEEIISIKENTIQEMRVAMEEGGLLSP